MNPPSLPPVTRPSTLRLWLWLFVLAPALLFLVLVASVASLFYPGPDVRALRNGLMKSSGVEWRQQIALNARHLPLCAIRAGLSCVKLAPEARAAVQSIRSAGVGVYQLVPGKSSPDRAAMLTAADSAMNKRGWERVVGVMDGKGLVAVYLPGKNVSLHRLKCCVLVFDGKEVVLVSAQGNLEPLLTYALKQPGICHQARWLVQR